MHWPLARVDWFHDQPGFHLKEESHPFKFTDHQCWLLWGDNQDIATGLKGVDSGLVVHCHILIIANMYNVL